MAVELALTVYSAKRFRPECLFNEIYFYEAEARKQKSGHSQTIQALAT